jgi:hypothetical protein
VRPARVIARLMDHHLVTSSRSAAERTDAVVDVRAVLASAARTA